MDANTQPEPAPGQIWRTTFDGDVTVIRIDPASDFPVRVRDASGDEDGFYEGPFADRFVCVGVETPHGRVMVGERRRYLNSEWDVRAIGGGGVRMFPVSGGANLFARDSSGLYPFPAEDVAQWPIVTEPASSPNAGAWADAIAKADRQIERALLGHVSTPMLDSARVAYTFDRVSIDGRIMPMGADIRILPGHVEATVSFTETKANSFEDAQRALDAITQDARIVPPWEERRRIVSENIDADARKCPAFATARRAAIIAAFEGAPPLPPVEIIPTGVEMRLLAALHAYEANRGGDHKPRPYASKIAASVADPDTGAEGPMFVAAIETYERNRGRA